MSPRFKSKRETFKISENSKDLQLDFQKNYSKTNFLVELMHKLNAAKSEDHLLKLTAEACFKIFDIDGIAVFFPDKEKKFLVAKIIQGIEKNRLIKAQRLVLFKKMPLEANYSVAKAYISKKIAIVQSTLTPSLKKGCIKTVIALPMVVNNESLGVLALGFWRKAAPNESDQRTGEMLATHLATSIYNLTLVSSLKTQNEWLQIVQENIREGFSLIGPDDVIYYTNKTVAKLFGTKGNIVGMKRDEIVKHWNKLHRFRVERFFESSDLKKVIFEKKEPFLGGLMKVYSNPPRFVEANYYPVMQNKKLLGMAASYRDVTKEKKQEVVLEEQMQILETEKERFEAIVSNVEEGICLVDSSLRILHMNSACENTSGWGLEEARGEYYYKVFRCHTKLGLYYPDFSPIEKVLITKEPTVYEEYLQHNREGDEFWVGVSASPILNSLGEVSEIVLVIRDISSLKEVEKAKSEFVSIASHELRTPLTVVNGYLSLLRDGDLGDFTTQESRTRLGEILEKVSNETTRLTHLVSDLLNVSRIEENRIVLNRKSQELTGVIENVVEEMRIGAMRKKIKLYYKKAQGEQIYANFDFDKICQVIINLIDNSMKFTPGGGEIIINSWQEDSRVFVEVADNGSGIPHKLLPVVFEKFQQVPGSYLKENRGTGLGLFIVKSLVDLHGGDINIESEVGKGTKVTFSVPT